MTQQVNNTGLTDENLITITPQIIAIMTPHSKCLAIITIIIFVKTVFSLPLHEQTQRPWLYKLKIIWLFFIMSSIMLYNLSR
jgi:hypothetical protein